MITDYRAATTPTVPAFGDPKWNPHHHADSLNDPKRVDEAKKVRIIVVDDEALIGETVAEILKSEGFEATAVSSGVDAIELARTTNPNIVLSDVIMPGLNGIETGIRIREIVPNCKIILFSGQAATVDLLAKAREGGHQFEILAKPIRPAQLISVIRKNTESLQ